jgi:hypothetical protein
LNVPKDKNVDSMKYFLLLIALLIFSCKSDEILIKSNSVSILNIGNKHDPLVYYGYIKGEQQVENQERLVLLYFFDKKEILYKIPPIECRGGLYFFTLITGIDDEITLSIPESIKHKYHYKFVLDKFKILNDSTILGSNNSVFKKLPPFKDNYIFEGCLKNRNLYTDRVKSIPLN